MFMSFNSRIASVYDKRFKLLGASPEQACPRLIRQNNLLREHNSRYKVIGLAVLRYQVKNHPVYLLNNHLAKVKNYHFW